jgi:hypothetical protein
MSRIGIVMQQILTLAGNMEFIASASESDTPQFHFTSSELLGITTLLHEHLTSPPETNLPILKVSSEFPYQVEGELKHAHLLFSTQVPLKFSYPGQAWFVCPRDSEAILGTDIDGYAHCGPTIIVQPGTDQIAHNSVHI